MCLKLSSLEEEFYPFYVCIATRRFFFFLDPFKSGKVKICDILDSGFLEDLVVEVSNAYRYLGIMVNVLFLAQA